LPPDGWYPKDFFRDELETAFTRLPVATADRFRRAVGRVDEKFKSLTHQSTTAPEQCGAAWWWHRVPHRPGLV
jgi:hypothetical protein